MPVESVLWALELGAIISRMSRWRRAPLSAAVVFAVVDNGCFALRTISFYLVFEKLNRICAMRAFDIENRIKAPVLCIISGAFSHGYIYIIYPTSVKPWIVNKASPIHYSRFDTQIILWNRALTEFQTSFPQSWEIKATVVSLRISWQLI